MSTWVRFFTSQLCFSLETGRKFNQVAYDNSQMILKSILRCRKTINSPKNYFLKKQLCKEWFANVIARTARADDNNDNTHLFSLLSIRKLKNFLLNLRYETHG